MANHRPTKLEREIEKVKEELKVVHNKVDQLKDLPGMVNTMAIAIGGSPLVTDENNPAHPTNSIVGRIKAGVEHNELMEERVQQAVSKIKDATLELESRIEQLKGSTLTKQTIGAFLWKYKIRIILVLVILVLEGPRAVSWLYEVLKARYTAML